MNWTDGHNIFIYHHPTQPGASILCDFGVEVTRTFETAGEVHATETPRGEAAAYVTYTLAEITGKPARTIHDWAADHAAAIRT